VLSDVNWRKTICVFNHPNGNLYINVKERFEGGIVNSAEYEETVKRIVDFFGKLNKICRKILGIPLFSEITLVNGFNHPLQYPDMVVEPHPDVQFIINFGTKKVLVERVPNI